MDQTDRDATTVSVDSPGTPLSPVSASDATGVAERDGVTSRTANCRLIDLPRPTGLSTVEVVTLIRQPADSAVLPRISVLAVSIYSNIHV